MAQAPVEGMVSAVQQITNLPHAGPAIVFMTLCEPKAHGAGARPVDPGYSQAINANTACQEPEVAAGTPRALRLRE